MAPKRKPSSPISIGDSSNPRIHNMIQCSFLTSILTFPLRR